MWLVAETVVAPFLLAASTGPKSRVDTFTTSLAGSPKISSSAGLKPTLTTPPIMAIVAGIAPPARTFCSICAATTTLRGLGKPWLIIVDSSATTAPPLAKVSFTSG